MNPAKTFFVFDFDGTLAPIVTERDDALMTERTRKLFGEFARRYPTAVISGRSLADLKPRLPSEVRCLVGNHGLEGIPGADPSEDAKAAVSLWRKRLLKKWPTGVSGMEVEIEDKIYSLTLHYRKAQAPDEVKRKILRAVSALTPHPRVIEGKAVVNLLPRGEQGKGSALLRLMDHFRFEQAFYIGDDDTDEDVFRMKDPRVTSVRVGWDEASHAEYFVESQEQVDQILDHLLQLLPAKAVQ